MDAASSHLPPRPLSPFVSYADGTSIAADLSPESFNRYVDECFAEYYDEEHTPETSVEEDA